MGSIVAVIKGDIRSFDYSSYAPPMIADATPKISTLSYMQDAGTPK